MIVRAGVALATLVVVAGSACGWSERDSSPGPTASQARAATDASEPRAVLGFVFGGQRAELRRLHPLTLRPDGGTKATGLAAGAHTVSPDGRTLVVGSGDGIPRLRFVDLRSLRLRASLELPGSGWPTEFIWHRAGRLTVLLQGEEPRIVTVDPRRPRVLGSSRLPGATVAYEARGRRLGVLLAPPDRIGPARLAVIDARRGLVGTLVLAGITAGTERIDRADDQYAMRSRMPGIAVSPDGARAVVVSAGTRVAEIDLRALRATFHDLSEPVSLLGRVRDWLEPRAHAKVMEGPYRVARFAGERYVAVGGIDYHGLQDGKWKADAAGLSLIDTRDWSVRRVADHVTGIVRIADVVLAFGGSWPQGAKGAGLLAYGSDGARRFHALGDEAVGWVETAWPFGYVAGPAGRGQRFRVVDLRSGRVVATTRTERTVSVLAAVP